MTSTVALDRLYISELNVRKTDRAIDIDQLADDIAAKGLLQNLVVVPDRADDGSGRRGYYGVVAGGRRLLALQLLVERGTLPANKPIPVVEEKREDGRAVSLSENMQRVDMNPADEFEAFGLIIADYAERGEADPAVRIDRCARHFGVTPRAVEERLRLAALAPDIFDALRTGAITLASAKAYAAYPDQDLQMRVFAELEGISHALRTDSHANRHSVAAIRARLAGRVYRQNFRPVLYIGVQAYLDAGGACARELFMGTEDQDVLTDPALVDRLALAKADEDAAALAEARGFGGHAFQPFLPIGTDQPPRAPRGMLFAYGGADLLTADERAAATLIARLDEHGRMISTDNYFRPERVRAPGALVVPLELESTGRGVASALADGSPPRHESAIEQLARIRRQNIERIAARMAAPSVAGTPFDGPAFWPSDEVAKLDPIHRAANGDYVVALLLRISAAEVEAIRPAAERAFDRTESERAVAGAGLATSTDIDAPPTIPPDRLDREPDWPLRPVVEADIDARTPEPAL